MEEKLIGKIIHYYPKISVGIIELSDGLSASQTVHIKGKKTDFQQAVGSIQIEHQDVASAKAGDSIGVKVEQPVQENDLVYLISE